MGKKLKKIPSKKTPKYKSLKQRKEQKSLKPKSSKIKKQKTPKSKKKKYPNKKNEQMFILQRFYDNDDLQDCLLEEEYLENLPHDKFDIYDVPKSVVENQQYLTKVIKENDIILEMLDARDIFYSLDKNIEELINKENQLLIYVINKMDLVSPGFLRKVINVLSKEINKQFPILCTSCLCREKIQELYNNIKAEIMKSKNSSRFQKKKNELLKIGVIGMPNVGKNSLLQSFELMSNSDCNNKMIYFEDNKTFCIDSVPACIYGDSVNDYLISKTYKNVEDIPNPISLLNNLFNVVNQSTIKEVYGLKKEPDNLKNLISCLKKEFGMNSDKLAIQKILQDIILGKITYEKI